MNNCINSSKVYCKSPHYITVCFYVSVLIVAKCIVNKNWKNVVADLLLVLIVAKCIVNTKNENLKDGDIGSINSSKVYCKCYILF